MAANWGGFRIEGDDLSPAELAFNETMGRYGPQDAFNLAFGSQGLYFRPAPYGFGGSGGKLWTQLFARFGDDAHKIVNTFSGGGSNQSDGAYRGYVPGYRAPPLDNPIPALPRPRPERGRPRVRNSTP